MWDIIINANKTINSLHAIIESKNNQINRLIEVTDMMQDLIDSQKETSKYDKEIQELQQNVIDILKEHIQKYREILAKHGIEVPDIDYMK